jgi:hypothetical protein
MVSFGKISLLWTNTSAHYLDQVLGLTNQLVRRATTDSGVGTDCEVEDIEHSEEPEEGASEEEDVWSRCVTTSNLRIHMVSN